MGLLSSTEQFKCIVRRERQSSLCYPFGRLSHSGFPTDFCMLTKSREIRNNVRGGQSKNTYRKQ